MQQHTDAVRAKNITKRYPGVLALDDVSISIAPGEVRAILGKNGAGKSTLIRSLTGAETPDVGEVLIGDNRLDSGEADRAAQASAIGVRAVYQELTLIPEMSVAENLFLGRWPSKNHAVDWKAAYAQASEWIETLRFPLDPKSLVSSLGPAKRQLVEIARAMLGNPKLVILDEPTSSLSSEEVDLLFDAIRSISKRGVAVIYVSHRMREIRAISNSATVLRDGKLIETFDVKSRSTEEVVAMMLGDTAVEVENVKEAKSFNNGVSLNIRDLTIARRVSGINFELRKGEVLGLAGLLGSGRTEILRAIVGLDQPESGTIEHHGSPVNSNYIQRLRSGIAITPENRKDDGIFPQLSVNENVVLADPPKVSNLGVFSANLVRKAVQNVVDQLSVKTASLSTPISMLSGGNQQKLVIGRWIYAGSDVLLLDEPTRGVDVEAKAQLYLLVRELASKGKSVVFVSSEIEELPLVCDRVLVLRDGHIVEEFNAPDINADSLLNSTLK
ncbi:fused putative sugar transporter subunits of ABC superfamily: ATP-binding components [Vibrio nigripulchritudo SOn1]|uniref:Fused putative sugar transporter subunits of ABC superfamily: ATP-binding components n=1 Tax=Vibrio nigripulchritudo SOn1 TaxID=1238450 RepID=A0AAV2VZZ4_9VIBR|nr:sugar ABC transporter ATP-binding protein [Vibrio nigripulchritudo]CCO50345.1 fused putative sugar transporter subunits of ABC superfamily: ATP-binding components [Vibrio nigripulchritudo SOn1]